MLKNTVLFLLDGSWFLLAMLCGGCLFLLCRHFVQVRARWWQQALLLLTLGGAAGMIIWIGDNNLLYTLPVFAVLFLLCTKGDWIGRLAVMLIFFCLIMSVSAMLDTYLNQFLQHIIATHLARVVIWGLLFLAMRRRLPPEVVILPRRLWKLILGLSAMPLFSMIAVVLLTHQRYDSAAVNSLSRNQGLAVLPFVFLTSLTLLFAILFLADYERLEQAYQLSEMREVYYQSLRREERQVRTLRHDLRNHLTALRGLLEQGDTAKAMGYLDQISDSPAYRGVRRFCENETANAVLAGKAAEMEAAGLILDFQAALPAALPVADIDLCALLGNALDNAMEAAVRAENKTVLLRAGADKGLLMLRVRNFYAGKAPKAALPTTKANPAAHGFGLRSMQEIASRYGGTLETDTHGGRFELTVCLPVGLPKT